MSVQTLLFVWLAALPTLGYSSQLCEDAELPLPLHRFSTKTGYFEAVKDERHWPRFKEEVWGCTAKQVWFLGRHGTRFPTANDMGRLEEVLPGLGQSIVDNHKEGRGCLKPADLGELSQWIPPYGPKDMEQLQEMGYDELFAIGEYWRNLFPHLHNVPFDPIKFKVEFTIKNRTGQSAYHFLRGMFGDDAVGSIELPTPHHPNFKLRGYKSCPRWLREVYKNEETTYKERRLFVNTDVYQNVTIAVSSRLGFTQPLTPREMESMYDECRYEKAWWPQRKSVWCSAFTEYDLEVMEYQQDLKYYYEDSFGTPLNGQVSCKTISDLYTYFRTTIARDEASPQGIFYFAHDKTIFKLLSRLGLYRPKEHLKHNNFAEMRDRVWRTGFISPFSANIGFVLYRCGLEYKIGVFFEGNPVPLTELCHGVMCRWEELQPWLHENYHSCDISQICMMHDEL